MAEAGDGEPVSGPPGTQQRPCAGLGRALPGRLLLSTPPPGRLTSLRSRDLTLGGFKKKTFTPNVHSIRKVKDEQKEESCPAPKKERKEREERQRDRQRRERPQTIQSHSIFEQGPADTFRKIGGWGGASRSECDPALVIKAIKKEKNAPADDDNDGEILQKLQRDDFLDDPGLKNDPKLTPIRLPLHQSCNYVATKTATSLKQETAADASLKADATQRQPSLLADLFRQLSLSDKEELLFVQLPDSLPGPLKAPSSEKVAKKDGKGDDNRSAQAKAQDLAEKEAAATLSDFSEGLLGKLQIRKSGKVQLLLGDVALDVSEGAAFSFLQQLVSVRLAEGLTGDMMVLGNVNHKLVCSPDFESLLQHNVKGSPSTRSVSQT